QDGLALQLQPAAMLMPGKYIVRTKTKKFLHTVTEEHSFTVGTASMNTNRSSYIVGDPVSVFMGVVDSQGKTVCDATLRLTVTKPDHNRITLHTDGGGIASSAECGPESLTDLPDYSA